VAALYVLLVANVIAVIQLIVYAGGTLILLVFGVMLTSKSPWAKFEVKGSELAAAALVCLIFAVGLITLVTTTDWPVQADQTVSNPPMGEFGWSLLTTYLVPFEVVSVLLLVVLIGAAYLARQE
jgi:NADH-quinone oxidoreductase subunit J